MTVTQSNTTPVAPRLHCVEQGDGDPVVLVHGGWSDHRTWALVAPALAESHRVAAYDRRGHGRSEPMAAGTTRRDHERDLAELIEALGSAPAHLVGTSFGGSIALATAARRPELVRSVVVHEPPLISLVAGDPSAMGLIRPVVETLATVGERIERGDHDGATRQFVEEIALGPGAWEQLPPEFQAVAVASARSFAIEQHDPGAYGIDRGALASLSVPVLVTAGDQSPAWFAPIVAELVGAIPEAGLATFAGAGHAPHMTNPADYAAAVTAFLGRASA